MGIPVATITSNDTPLDEAIDVLSVEIRRAVNRIPEATIVVLDGSVAARKFEVSNSDFFAPGKRIGIALRYEGEKQGPKVFEGLVVRHAVDSAGEGTSLRVELKDAAFKLTRARASRVFHDATDSDAMEQLLPEAARGDIARTTVTHTELVQYNATDWDFVLSRAEVNGLAVDAHLGKVSTKKVALGDAKLTLKHGLDDVSALALEIDGADQWAEMSGVGWDPAGLAATAPEATSGQELPVGNLKAVDIANALGGATYTLLHPAPVPAEERKAWAEARLLQSRFTMLRGTATVSGNATLAPLDTVAIEGVGARFDGKALVSEVTHTIDTNGWQTELKLGLSPEWFARRPDIAEVPAGGMLPPVRGLQLAVVGGFVEDPRGDLRVKVKLAALQEEGTEVFARLAAPDAGPYRGFVFRPELGDEVVLGFVDGDPREAVVLGALHGSAHALPKPIPEPGEKNPMRAIVSRAGTRILFDDDKPSLTLEVADGGNEKGTYKNRIVIDQGGKTIAIEDEHGNVVKLDQNGITLTSGKDFTIDAAKGAVVIKGKTVDLQ